MYSTRFELQKLGCYFGYKEHNVEKALGKKIVIRECSNLITRIMDMYILQSIQKAEVRNQR